MKIIDAAKKGTKAPVIKSSFPEDDLHYEKLGISRNEIKPWEDGMRTSGKDNTYEWWYFDSHYSDGTVLVIVFYTKNIVMVRGGIRPLATMELTLPDGRKFYNQITESPGNCSFSSEGCHVINGDSYIKGDLLEYEIVFNGPTMSAKVNLKNTIGPWRPKCGQILFGDSEEYSFNWLPSVPEGEATAEIQVEGKTLNLKGTGYHDHNWGNISMFKLMHHWYWGRAKIGVYKVISSWITAGRKYGYNEFDIFMLAKGNEIIGDNSNHTLKFSCQDEYLDNYTGKLVYNKIIYNYIATSGDEYKLIYDRKKDIAREFFYESLPKSLRPLAKKLGFKGSYQRFEGKVTLERARDGIVLETVTEDSAVWELMYFG